MELERGACLGVSSCEMKGIAAKKRVLRIDEVVYEIGIRIPILSSFTGASQLVLSPHRVALSG